MNYSKYKNKRGYCNEVRTNLSKRKWNLLSKLKLPDTAQKAFGKYGHMRLEYLKKHRRGTYTTLLAEGKLNEHLCQIDTEARKMVKQICNELAKQNAIDEELKSHDPMKWAQEMNNAKTCAEEVVLHELVYA